MIVLVTMLWSEWQFLMSSLRYTSDWYANHGL